MNDIDTDGTSIALARCLVGISLSYIIISKKKLIIYPDNDEMRNVHLIRMFFAGTVFA